MLVYKYRSAESLTFVLDVILNERLYCANPLTLNDPFEAEASFSIYMNSNEENQKGMQSFRSEVEKLRVCSMSKADDVILMWSHYASNFAGVVVELDVPNEDLVELTYDDNHHFGTTHIDNPKLAANCALSRKRVCWDYEQEARLVLPSNKLESGFYYLLKQPVKRIVIGQRLREAEWGVLRKICKERTIRVDRVNLKQEGIRFIQKDL